MFEISVNIQVDIISVKTGFMNSGTMREGFKQGLDYSLKNMKQLEEKRAQVGLCRMIVVSSGMKKVVTFMEAKGQVLRVKV